VIAVFAKLRLRWCALAQLRQTHRDETGDHSSDGDQQSPPNIVVSFLFLGQPRFGFVTQPTKRCLPLPFTAEATAAVGRVAELCPRRYV